MFSPLDGSYGQCETLIETSDKAVLNKYGKQVKQFTLINTDVHVSFYSIQNNLTDIILNNNP